MWRFLRLCAHYPGRVANRRVPWQSTVSTWRANGRIMPIHKIRYRNTPCWVHKTANVLNKLPKYIQAKAKTELQQIWMALGQPLAETREDAHHAFATFVQNYQPKYPKAAECLAKDHESMLGFYDFPAEHWHHIRTSNPIESTFASVRLRTAKTRGCGSRTSILSMVFKLTMSAEQRWLKLRGAERITEIVQGVKFKNGVREQSQKIAA